jgi:hypothetical protein
LGKAGRRWDLGKYLRSHGSISVRDYMRRYGVGQKRAVAELRAFGCLHTSGTGRKQTDVYLNRTEDVIADIQDMIGGTVGGVPFASRDEIARWLECGIETNDHYPKWLRRQFDQDVGKPAEL